MALGLLVHVIHDTDKRVITATRGEGLCPSLLAFVDLDASLGEMSVRLQPTNPPCTATERSPRPSAMYWRSVG